MVDSRLLEEQYYHGLLPREDLKEMLRSNGEFLVRTTEPVAGRPRAFVLSVMADQMKEEHGIKHYVIQRMNSGKYMIDWLTFTTISDLIFHHMSTKESISKSNYVVLRTPIVRQQWELEHSEVEVTRKLGEGAFGEVSLGRMTRKGTRETLNVAIKLAKLESLTKEQVKEIMHEARLMRMFDHPNVIRIYGVAALQEPLMLVMELASDGSLDGYLRKNQVQVSVKTQMCVGASFGLEYLHSVCNVMHRDIAARNCLYGGGQVKISDFGLTQEGNSYQMDPTKRVPIRWLSPETLRTALYTQKSDVFSYGVLCWEIYANGMEPYPNMPVGEVSARVKAGYRMSFPDAVPREVAAMITQRCWADAQSDRFAMEDVSKFWERFLGVEQPKKKKKQPVIQPVQPTSAVPFAQAPAASQPAQAPPANPMQMQPMQAPQMQPMQAQQQVASQPMQMQPMQAQQQVAPQFQAQPMQMQVPPSQMVQAQPTQQEMMSVPVMFNSQGQIMSFPQMMPQPMPAQAMPQGMPGVVTMQGPQGGLVAMQPVEMSAMMPTSVLTMPLNESGATSTAVTSRSVPTTMSANSSSKKSNDSASVLSSPKPHDKSKSSSHKKKKTGHKKKSSSHKKKSPSHHHKKKSDSHKKKKDDEHKKKGDSHKKKKDDEHKKNGDSHKKSKEHRKKKTHE